LHEFEEGLRIHLLLAGEKKFGEDVIVTFAKFEIEHGSTPRRCQLETRRVYLPSSHDSEAAENVPELVVVGAASRDLASDDPRGWRLGGAATYCSLAAARLGLRVGCLLGVDAEAAEATELGLLRAAGVDLRLLPLARGPVFENIEEAGRRRQRWLSKSDSLPIGALPRVWKDATGWLFVPVAGEVGDGWADVPGPGARIEVGPQGLLREFADDGWVKRVAAAPSGLLATAGLVCASVGDLEPGTTLKLLRQLAPDASIVLTAGDAGGVVVAAGEMGRYSAIPADRVVDPTGAGDVFLAALTAVWFLVGERATPRALRFAAAAGSCAVEGVGLAGVPDTGQVAARLLGRKSSVGE
jgi:pfkB family carbohydrate kinase